MLSQPLTVNLYCSQPLLDHLTQSSYPEDLREALRPFDAAMLTTAKIALGLDLAHPLALRRVRLSSSLVGASAEAAWGARCSASGSAPASTFPPRVRACAHAPRR
jgi:hypothetical protein